MMDCYLEEQDKLFPPQVVSGHGVFNTAIETLMHLATPKTMFQCGKSFMAFSEELNEESYKASHGFKYSGRLSRCLCYRGARGSDVGHRRTDGLVEARGPFAYSNKAISSEYQGR